MITSSRSLAVLVLAAVLLLPGAALAQGPAPQDQIVFGDNYTLAAGEAVRNLHVFGGNAVLEAGSTVTDHVFVYGGNLNIYGAVAEGLHVYGGNVDLGDSAVIGGDIALAGGNFDRAAGAVVTGNVTRIAGPPFGIRLPEFSTITVPRFWSDAGPLVRGGVWFLVQSFGLAALAVLAILLAPRLTERAGDAAVARPLEAGGLGLLVAIVTPPLLVGFAVTLIGIPITLLLAVAAGVLLVLGWVALGLEVGKRLAQAFQLAWPAVLSGGLGTLLLALVANGIGLVPCVGWIVPVLVGFVGMGGVILSRFGARAYPPAVSAAPGAA